MKLMKKISASLLSAVMALSCFTFIVRADDVVNVGTWTALKEAIDGVQEGETVNICLTNDIEWDNSGIFTVKTGTEVILDLNNHKIDRKIVDENYLYDATIIWTKPIFMIQQGAKMTLKNSVEGENCIIGGNNNRGYGGAFSVSGELTIEGGIICYNRSLMAGAGVYVDEGGKVVMNGGVIGSPWDNRKGNTSTMGAGVYIQKNGQFILNGGSILKNDSSAFSKNRGAGVAINAGGYFEMNGGLIKGNLATGNTLGGAGVYIYGSKDDETGETIPGVFKMTGGHFVFNETNQNGGGIYVTQYGKAEIVGGSFGGAGDEMGNTGDKAVSGADIYSEGELTVSDVLFTNSNAVGTPGGAVCIAGGSASIENCEFINNSGAGAGAIAVSASGSIDIENCSFVENHSGAGKGGAFYILDDADVSISDSDITRNASYGSYEYNANMGGGGIFLENGTLSLSGVEIVGNTANVCGGGIFLNNGTLNLEDVTITENEASITEGNSRNGYGGGIYCKGGTLNISGLIEISGNFLEGIGYQFPTDKDNTIAKNDLYFYNPNSVINIVGELDEESRIGILPESTSTPVRYAFTNGFSDHNADSHPRDFFFSDSPNYVVSKEDLFHGTTEYSEVGLWIHTHEEAEAVRENEKPATCTDPASYESVVYCSDPDCDYEFSRETKTEGEPLGHDWEFVRFDWSGDDTDGYYAVSLVYTCKNEEEGNEHYFEWNYDSEEVDADCTKGARTVYTTEIDEDNEFDGLYHTDTKEVPYSDPLGHDWVFDGFEWTGSRQNGYTKVVAKYHCSRNEGHVTEPECTFETEVIAPTCEEDGYTKYTVSLTEAESLDGDVHSDEMIALPVSKTGHDWEFVEFQWTGSVREGYTGVSAVYKCNNEEEGYNAVPLEFDETDFPATCETDGYTHYEVSVSAADSLDGQSHDDNKNAKIVPHSGHNWVFVKIIWTGSEANGYTKAVAKYKCENGTVHYKEVACKLESEVTDPSCESGGFTTYYASISKDKSPDGEEHSDEKTAKPTEAVGHSWVFDGFSWEGNDVEGYGEVYATFHCSNEEEGLMAVEASLDVKTVEVTCEKDGMTVYTASITKDQSLDGKAHSEKKEVITEKATGHDWVFEGFTWTGDNSGYSKAIATYSCSNGEKHYKEVKATLSTEITKATCEKDGKTVYKALISADKSPDGKLHQDSKTVTAKALGHKWGEWTVTVEPTEYTEGSKQRVCENDKSHIEKKTIPMLEPEPEKGVDDFIERLYKEILGRPSDPEGRKYWENKVLSEGYTGADLARGFLYSDEFLNKEMSEEDFLDVLYRVFFDRLPDPAGKADWLNRMHNLGWSKRDVIQGFIDSTEWANLWLEYGIPSGGTGVAKITVKPKKATIEFCKRLYHTGLERMADPIGLIDWSLQLANQKITGTEAARGIFFSQEFINKKLSDEEFLTRLYIALMDRQPDKAGFDNWLKLMKGGMSREDVFKGFANSKEFGAICVRYGIIR